MPVIIEPKDFGPWLSGEAGTELLRPAPDNRLRLWSVSKRVNRTGNVNDPALIEEISLGAWPCVDAARQHVRQRCANCN
jgi:putative SOS response-associated peptidase YedK